MNKNSFTEPELNKLGWKVVSELSGDRTIKDIYTATGKPENERVEVLYGKNRRVIMAHRFDEDGKCIAAWETNRNGQLVTANPARL